MDPSELRRQAQLEDQHFWYAARRRQVHRQLPIARTQDQRALDLGAGSGGNTRLLTDAGYRAVALEHHSVAAGIASLRGIPVIQGDAQELPFPDHTFDVVLACDVLEHLRDDDACLREVRRVLRPGGRLVVTVPADPALWSDHDVALDHQRRYTRVTLSAVLTSGGLRIDSMSSWMVLLRPFVAMRRTLRARRRHGGGTAKPGSDLEEVSASLNWMLGLVLRVEHQLPRLGRSSRGVSLIAVASNPDT